MEKSLGTATYHLTMVRVCVRVLLLKIEKRSQSKQAERRNSRKGESRTKMSKVNATVTGKVEKKARKSTKGIPRITNKVLAGGEALETYKVEVAKLSATVQAECLARLEAAQKAGPKANGGGAVGKLQRKVAKLTAALATAQASFDEAVLADAAAEEAKLNAIVAKANAQIEILKAAKARKEEAVKA